MKLENTAQTEAALIKAIGNLPIHKLCEMRNKLIPHDIAFVHNQELKIYPLEQIKEWAECIELDFNKRDDVEGCPWHFVINGRSSEERFDSRREAIAGAFHSIVINNDDLSDYDLFNCPRCGGYFDTGLAKTIGENAFCQSCASKM